MRRRGAAHRPQQPGQEATRRPSADHVHDAEGLVVQEADLFPLLGKPPFSSELMFRQGETRPPGVIMGLAWTAMGGSVLFLECVTVGGASAAAKARAERSSPGTPAAAEAGPQPPQPPAPASGGTLKTTGKLGEVMQESIAAALTSRTPVEELQQHFTEIEFRLCISACFISRFLTEHVDVLPLSCQSRITDTHDVLVLTIPLIENPPWTRCVYLIFIRYIYILDVY